MILVEITAYSDDNAYTIFESMNDRGLNLTSTEMLKGYILSVFRREGTERANSFWKKELIQELHSHSKEEDQKFFQAWLRSQYADTIRQSKAGSMNEDFEKIGTRFHSWFRDNLAKMGLKADSPESFVRLVHQEVKYYLRAYLDILAAQKEEKAGWEHVFYHFQWGIADSLGFPLMLAPLKSTDSPEVTRQKINEVTRYLETFAVRRSINFRNFSASSIRYTMYTLAEGSLPARISTPCGRYCGANWMRWKKDDGIREFRLHGMNRYLR